MGRKLVDETSRTPAKEQFRSLMPSGEVGSVPVEEVLIGMQMVDAADLSDIGSEIEVGEEEPEAGDRLIRFIVKDKRGNIKII